jgi:hypothetical protein
VAPGGSEGGTVAARVGREWKTETSPNVKATTASAGNSARFI